MLDYSVVVRYNVTPNLKILSALFLFVTDKIYSEILAKVFVLITAIFIKIFADLAVIALNQTINYNQIVLKHKVSTKVIE